MTTPRDTAIFAQLQAIYDPLFAAADADTVTDELRMAVRRRLADAVRAGNWTDDELDLAFDRLAELRSRGGSSAPPPT